jgi:hypothetical protein
MEQIPPWEANSSSASQEIPRILWNPKAHCRIYKSPPPVPILSRIDPVHVPYPTSWKYILILSPHLRLSLSISLRSRDQNVFCTSPVSHTCFMPSLSHFSWCDHANNKWWEEQSSSFLRSPVTSSLLAPNIFLNTLFSNSLSLRSSHSVSDQISTHTKQKAKLQFWIF